MRSVTFEGPDICGEVCAVYGLMPMDDMIFHDPDTIKGLGIGGSFNMRDGDVLRFNSGEYALADTGLQVESALSMWVLKDEMQAYCCTQPHGAPAGYTAEELERDNPYNQWMHE